MFSRRKLPILVALLSAASVLQAILSSLDFSFEFHEQFLGNSHIFFWPLMPLMLVISTGLVTISCMALSIIIAALRVLSSLKLASKSKSSSAHGANSPHIGSLIFLILLVAFWIPSQLAFLICFVVQLVNCALARRGSNQQFMALLVMFWLLPLHAPILVVWSRHVYMDWNTPFPSDHNPLLVAPFMLLVDALGRDINFKSSETAVTNPVILALAAAVFLYGPRHAYILIELSSMAAGILILTAWLNKSVVPIEQSS